MEEESHEIFPSDGSERTNQRFPLRNPGSRVVHGCLIIPLLMIMALSLTSLSYFATTDSRIKDIDIPGSGDCVLYGEWKRTLSQMHLSSGHACVFSLFGEVAVAVLAALLILWMVVKAAAGFYVATWMVFCELPVIVLHMVFAFCVSVTVSIGLAVTCGAYHQYPTAKGSCKDYSLPKPNATGHTVFFYDNIRTSEVTSWLAVVVLFFLLLMYVLISIVFCVKCTRKTVAPTIPTSDGESSSDGENESEDMVPIAELEHR